MEEEYEKNMAEINMNQVTRYVKLWAMSMK